jgi:hypothetical protein
MKKIIFFSVALLCLFKSGIAQTEIITFPTEGSVFQANSSGVYRITFSGQVKTTLPLFYRIEKRNGADTWEVIVNDATLSPDFNGLSGGIGRGMFSTTYASDLSKGWYRLSIYVKKFMLGHNFRLLRHQVQFGVGDVYFIAGQSNAAGYGGVNYKIQSLIGGTDNAVSSVLDNSYSSPMARIFNTDGNEQMVDPGLNNPQKIINFAIPYKTGFSEFKNGIKADPIDGSAKGERIVIYPNGYNSWYWAPLAHKIANPNGSHAYSGTPTMWFNVASPSTALQDNGLAIINIWNINPNLNSAARANFLNRPYNQTLMGKFKQTLETYAGPFGAKGVLWHQGESDHEGIMDGNTNVSALGYTTSLTNIIKQSRQFSTGDENNTSLNWFVAKATLYNHPSTISNSSISTGINISSLPNYSSYKSEPDDKLYSSATLRVNQTSNLPNVFEGPNTDDINSTNPNIQRSSHYFVHFSGNSLQKVADDWYAKINQTSNSLEPTVPLKISQVIKYSESSYKVIVDNSIGSTEFVWLVDGYGLNNFYSKGSDNFVTFNPVQPNYFLHGYAKKNGRWHAIMPFMVPGGSIESKRLVLSQNNLPVPTQGGTANTKITAVDTDWEIQSGFPSWIEISYDQDESIIFANVGPNNSPVSRSGDVYLKEIGGNGLSTYFTVTQPGATLTSTPLTSITPNNNSSGYQLNKTSSGGTMRVNNVEYTQGFGTHAPSSLFFTLNGQYSTLSGKVGRDDEVDPESIPYNSGHVQFFIKGDGVPLWSSSIHGDYTSAENFSVDVAGKNVIELYTDQSTDNNYYDHADWIDLYLNASCSTPPPAPTNVVANPATISSGSSTLTANCAIGTPVWSTGVSGISVSVTPTITTNYSVSCQSNGCPTSNTVGVTVTVTSNPCNAVSDNLTMGIWTVTGHPLVARRFNNQNWLTQRIGSSPETFLVRASEMLTRSDVTLTNQSYSGLVGCFAYPYSPFGGLQPPTSTEFPTPSGFTKSYESDNTPFYYSNGQGCAAGSPTNVVALPAGISAGQTSTLSATCPAGTTYLWSTGATSSSITVSPTVSTTYTIKCKQTGCADSPESNVPVTVGPCLDMTHNLVLGTWNVTGHQLVVKEYNGQKWLVQRIGTNPEKFLVRGSEMLTRSDVTLNNSSYSSKVGCFAWQYSNFGGLATPPVSSPGVNGVWFETPAGWSLDHEPDNTPFYISNGGSRISQEEPSLERGNESKYLFVYPNPASGSVQVKVVLKASDEIKIDLINSSGQIYRSQSQKGQSGENLVIFDLKGIKGGHYLIRAMTKLKTEAIPLVVE